VEQSSTSMKDSEGVLFLGKVALRQPALEPTFPFFQVTSVTGESFAVHQEYFPGPSLS